MFLVALPFAVVARLRVAVVAAGPPFAVAADGPQLPEALPGNGGPQRPRAMPRHPAGLLAYRRSWHRPWPFVPCGMRRPVARLFAGYAGPAVAPQQLSEPVSSPRWEVPSEQEPPVGFAFAKQPKPPVACAAGAVAARSSPLGGDGLVAVDRMDGAQKPLYGRPAPVP